MNFLLYREISSQYSDPKKAADWFLLCATEEYWTPWHERLKSYFKGKKKDDKYS